MGRRHKRQCRRHPWVLVEILDARGKKLEVISDAVCDPGYHMAAWSMAKYAPRNYKYPLRCHGHKEPRDLVLNKA